MNKLQNDKNKEQYTVEKLIHDITTKTEPYYGVRWRGYKSKDDTVKYPEH